MKTFRGHEYDFDSLDQLELDLVDIAAALSNICRWGGHVAFHYSVAQHSVLLSELVPDRLKRAALLHDAPEYVLGDLVTPFKRKFETYTTQFEEPLARRIFERFQCDYSKLKEVHRFDERIRVDEIRALHPMVEEHERIEKSYGPAFDIEIFPWTPEDAKWAFLHRCTELGIS